jgi:hypothetical protein
MRVYPQPLFSGATRSTSSRCPGFDADWDGPRLLLASYFWATRRRYQRNSVSGVSSVVDLARVLGQSFFAAAASLLLMTTQRGRPDDQIMTKAARLDLMRAWPAIVAALQETVNA